MSRQLADALSHKGHDINHRAVVDVLKELGYSLQANVKTRELSLHPGRDAQFHYLTDKVKIHEAKRQPVISVDTKKKELVGASRTPGGSRRERAS